MTSTMEAWKVEAQIINSRCGFCAKTFSTWQDRLDHLAKEFRNGATMKDWKGCRGLDPHVAQHVTNAMPPYLIANESRSPFPFSASNSSSMKHTGMLLNSTDLEVVLPTSINDSPETENFADEPLSSGSTQQPSTHTTSPKSPHPYATCWEILTLRLGQYARRTLEQNGPGSVTDAMLQSEARRILYETDDAWEQTAADNPEWLNLFRKAHGMDLTQPEAIADQYFNHEVLEDLGLTPHARLDESFNLKNFHCVTTNFTNPAARARAFECALAGSMAIVKAGGTSVPVTHTPGLTTSTSTSGESNLPTATLAGFGDSNLVMDDLEGTGAGGFCIGNDGELHTTSAPLSQSQPAFMTPIDEMTFNTSGGALDNGYGFPTFTTAGPDSSIMAEFGGNLPATSGFADLDLNTGAIMDDSQVLPWDDSELTFNMDLDMDMDMDLGFSSTSTA